MTVYTITMNEKSYNITSDEKSSKEKKINIAKDSNVFDFGSKADSTGVQKSLSLSAASNDSVFEGTASSAVNYGKSLADKVEEGDKTHAKITKGRTDLQWCAYAMTHIYENAGKGKSPFGPKNQVSEIKSWAEKSKRYVPFSGDNNAAKEKSVIKLLPKVAAGDMIVWKSNYSRPIVDGTVKTGTASHIGMFLEFDGSQVSVLEGNANLLKRDSIGRYYLVKNKEEGINGNQEIGEFQEILPKDKLIIKKYTIPDLVSAGLSGYINMQSKK